MREDYDPTIESRPLSPESLMMGYGYRPEWSEGALKSPIFQTSTFVFENAAAGKRFFEIAYGLSESTRGERLGLIYSRLNNPDLEILEDRLTVWDRADRALVFSSGMAAITTSFLAHLRPGDILLHSAPLYGGTDHVVKEILPGFGISTIEFDVTTSPAEIESRVTEAAGRLGMVFLETPANPTNDLFDIDWAAQYARSHSDPDRTPVVAVDNTFLGPVYQHPLEHGADLVLYSATKYIGGHSDLIAGVALGGDEVMQPIAAMRAFIGTMATPWTGWLIMRSMETLHLRMQRQSENAQVVADFLLRHPTVRSVHYLGHLRPGDTQYDLYERQCLGPGAMVAFELADEAAAFRFLDSLSLIKLAVSLGGTESLAEHPATMTHAGVDPDEKARTGVTDGLVRLSIGVEHPDDLVLDLETALAGV